ncbi:hypothetical protein Cadr_000021644 [Camelus dromedarius]|uniref:Uncharacterized protein n=1 Tax=Camelus dromedarius TaxID=9838 RepID=A0A5N4CS41_CAMDR|nr:hypothetical protein Cadr_000021644 [Camelus dromedarius]
MHVLTPRSDARSLWQLHPRAVSVSLPSSGPVAGCTMVNSIPQPAVELGIWTLVPGVRIMERPGWGSLLQKEPTHSVHPSGRALLPALGGGRAFRWLLPCPLPPGHVPGAGSLWGWSWLCLSLLKLEMEHALECKPTPTGANVACPTTGAAGGGDIGSGTRDADKTEVGLSLVPDWSFLLALHKQETWSCICTECAWASMPSPLCVESRHSSHPLKQGSSCKPLRGPTFLASPTWKSWLVKQDPPNLESRRVLSGWKVICAKAGGPLTPAQGVGVGGGVGIHFQMGEGGGRAGQPMTGPDGPASQWGISHRSQGSSVALTLPLIYKGRGQITVAGGKSIQNVLLLMHLSPFVLFSLDMSSEPGSSSPGAERRRPRCQISPHCAVGPKPLPTVHNSAHHCPPYDPLQSIQSLAAAAPPSSGPALIDAPGGPAHPGCAGSREPSTSGEIQEEGSHPFMQQSCPPPKKELARPTACTLQLQGAPQPDLRPQQSSQPLQKPAQLCATHGVILQPGWTETHAWQQQDPSEDTSPPLDPQHQPPGPRCSASLLDELLSDTGLLEKAQHFLSTNAQEEGLLATVEAPLGEDDFQALLVMPPGSLGPQESHLPSPFWASFPGMQSHSWEEGQEPATLLGLGGEGKAPRRAVALREGGGSEQGPPD